MADEIKREQELDEDEESEIIELTDEEGVTSQFEYLTTIDHEGELYVVLMLVQDECTDDDDDDGEVVILKIEKDENGDDIYVSVDDDAVCDAVFEKFMAMMEEEDGE